MQRIQPDCYKLIRVFFNLCCGFRVKKSTRVCLYFHGTYPQAEVQAIAFLFQRQLATRNGDDSFTCWAQRQAVQKLRCGSDEWSNCCSCQGDILPLHFMFYPCCHSCWSFPMQHESRIVLMKCDENGWVKSAPVLCTSHSSFSGLFIINASTENNLTAVTYLLSQPHIDFAIFPLHFLPAQENKENIFLCVHLLERILFSAVLMEYFKTFPLQLMDLKTAEHWLLCSKAHVHICLSTHLSVFQDRGGVSSILLYKGWQSPQSSKRTLKIQA